MSRFYFDFDDHGGTTIDTDGEEFPDIDAAKREALEALGDAARDFARLGAEDRLSVRIRDAEGAILEVSATFETRLIKP